ncbi:MAG TPA: hypothetical protein VFK21_00625 [Gammaproteobacteria bacterium]|nr:hypothetical protein [Gammaproteobacteria bacterium]
MHKMIYMGKVRLLNVLAEAALIVFSILFALYTNHWREERVARQRVDRDLAAIRVELQENRDLVADVLPYHQQEIASFGKFLARPDLEQLVRGKNMFQAVQAYKEALTYHGVWHPHVTPSTLSDAAWKTALANGDLPYMDPNLVKALTDYYSFQENGLMNDLQVLVQVYLSPAAYDRTQTITMLYAFQGAFTILADHGASLLDEANTTLRELPQT